MVVAAFSPDGPTKCSVLKSSSTMLSVLKKYSLGISRC